MITILTTIAVSTVALAFGSIIFNMWFDIPEELKKIACKAVVTILLLLLLALPLFAKDEY